MSTERDEFIDDIPRVQVGSGYYSQTIGYDEAAEIADELIELCYRKPAVVTTAEELDDLPYWSVVLVRRESSNPCVLQKLPTGWGMVGTVSLRVSPEWIVGDGETTVLHIGGNE